MTVAWQTAMIPLAGGPDTKGNPHAIEPPKLLVCDNAQFEEPGGIGKRPGESAMGLTKVETGTIASARCRAMGVRDDELLLYAESETRSWSKKELAWAYRRRFDSVLVDQRTVASDRSDQYLGDGAEAGNVIVYAWYDTVSNGVRYQFVDKVTRAIINTAASTFVASATRPVCRAVNGYLHVYYANSNEVFVDVVDVTDVYNTAGATIVTLSATDCSSGYYDVEVAGTQAILAYRTTGNQVKVMHVSGSAAAVTNSRTIARSCTGALAIAYSSAQVALARVYGGGVDGVAHDFLLPADLTDDTDVNTLVVTSAGGATIISVAVVVRGADSSYVAWGLLDPTTAPTYNEVRRALVDAAAVGAVAVLAKQASLASRAASFADGAVTRYLIMVHHNTHRVTTGTPVRVVSGLQPTYFLLDLAHVVGVPGGGTFLGAAIDEIGLLARLFPGEAQDRVDASGQRGCMPQLESLGSGVVRWVGSFARHSKAIIRNNFAERGLREVLFTFLDAKAYRGVQEGRATTLPGGFVATYDGTRVYESGFLLFPEAITVATSLAAPAGILQAGTYQYRFRWEWKNAQGELEWSSYCGNIAVTFGAGTTWSAVFTIPTNPFTLKTNVYLAAFRTELNSAGPHYRISPMDPSATGWVKNNINADTITFTDGATLQSPSGADGMTDLELVQQPKDYQADGELDSIPPPATSIVAAGQGRVFTLDPEDKNLVRFSKLRLPGDAVAFDDSLTIQVPQAGGDIVGLEVADTALVIFKEDAIYVSAGSGPSNVPTGMDDYGAPQRVADIGCDESSSIIRSPVGIFFRSKKGIYLIDGGYQTHYIGAPVDAYFAGAKMAVHLADKHQVRWYGTTAGAALLYDYNVGEWSRWTAVNGESAVIWQDTPVFLMTSEGPMEPDATFETFENVGIQLDVTTAWIKAAGIAGLYRMREVEILGAWKSAHSLRVQMWKDYDEPAASDYATGSVTTPAKASLLDGEYFTIVDSSGTAYVLEFDVNGTGVTSGRVQVNVSGDTSADQVRDTIISVINNTAGLRDHITAAIGAGTGRVDLTADDPGILGNQTITENVSSASFVVSGMSGAKQFQVTWTASPAVAGPVRFRIRLPSGWQKLTALKIRITDTASGTKEGLSLTGIGIVWAPKPGLGRLPSGQAGGGIAAS